MEKPWNEPVNIMSLRDRRPNEWRVINDGVMGGLSRSEYQSTDQETGLFTGELSLENNGGFASIRTLVGAHDLSRPPGSRSGSRETGAPTSCGYAPTDRWDGIAYRASFSAPGRQMVQRPVSLRGFRSQLQGRVVEDAGPLDAARIEQIGFLIADKVTEPFSLEIDFVRAWNPGKGTE